MFKTFAALSAALFVPALVVPASAAPDPCQRATQEFEEAEQAVSRWLMRNCRPGGSMQCTGNPARFNQLWERMENARANRARQCG